MQLKQKGITAHHQVEKSKSLGKFLTIRVTPYFSPQLDSLELMHQSEELIVHTLLISHISAIGDHKLYFAFICFKVYALQHCDLCIGNLEMPQNLFGKFTIICLITCDSYKSLKGRCLFSSLRQKPNQLIMFLG